MGHIGTVCEGGGGGGAYRGPGVSLDDALEHQSVSFLDGVDPLADVVILHVARCARVYDLGVSRSCARKHIQMHTHTHTHTHKFTHTHTHTQIHAHTYAHTHTHTHTHHIQGRRKRE